MKKANSVLASLFIMFMIFSACSSSQNVPERKQIDARLVGVWQGGEKDHQMAGVEKKWEMIRREDGTFTLNFKTIQNGETEEFVENGKWWVKGNTFFEYHENSGKTDVYQFTVLNKDQVKFDMKKSNVDFAQPDYTFIDTKISEVTGKE